MATRVAVGGYLDAAQRAGVEVIPTLFAFALPSGLVSSDALDLIVGRLVATVTKARPDAVLLDLHGAMAAEGSDDVEGALLGDLRARLGHVPIGVVFDFHANTTAAFVERVDVFAG